MSYLKIIKASAGSGKTFRLTLEYLKLLMRNDLNYYKHILAVTFTNKATGELKLRILDELSKLAYGKQSVYLQYLLSELNIEENRIRNKSKAILKHILHNYSRFRVETIDKFFLSVFREFTRELGLAGGNEVEIDQQLVLEEAVAKLYEDIEQNIQLRKWVLDYLEMKLLDGKSSDMNKELHRLGGEIFKESYMRYSADLQKKIADKEFLKKYYDSLQSVKTAFEYELKKIASGTLEKIHGKSLTLDDFYQKNKGPAGYFKKLSEAQIEEANSYVLAARDNPEKWSSKSSKHRDVIQALAVSDLIPALSHIMEIFDKDYQNYCTTLAVLKNIHILGIINDIQQNVHSVLRYSDRFILADISPFINKIVASNDAPFIFEKFGNRFHHFMIDEFQDTSESQWDNFKPLINNSIASGNENLLVGDVKQSIYRWRNSNWEILAQKLDSEFDKRFLDTLDLENNRRSHKNIIDFNNAVFHLLPSFIKNILIQNVSERAEETEILGRFDIEKIFHGSTQKTVETTHEGGYVQFDFFEQRDDDQDPVLLNLVNQIDLLIAKGYCAGDIAILVRKKDDGEKITEFLIKELSKTENARNTGVISNETLYLGNSSLINFIIGLLRFVLNPSDELNITFITSEYINYISHSYDGNTIHSFDEPDNEIYELLKKLKNERHTIQHMPLYEAVEYMTRVFDLKRATEERPYLISFLDLVFEFSNKNKTTINSFLYYWGTTGKEKTINLPEEQDAIRILTIHKAKGLEFKVVLIPYCSWSLEPHRDTILWSATKNKPFNALPLVPVNYSSRLAQTEFSEEYHTERIKSYIDNLNLLYVAFTRACEVLMVSAILPERKEQANFREILLEILPQLDIDIGISDNGQCFRFGEIPENELNEKLSELIPVPFESFNISDKLRIARTSQELTEDEGLFTRAGLNRGKVMHMIMEKMISVNDIESAVKRVLLQGLLKEDEFEPAMEYFQECLQKKDVSAWFDGSYRIITERDFILPGGSVKRPDRIMIKDDEVIVVDYKFGHNKPASHKKQLQEYMHLLEEMDYKVTTGVLWYIDLDDMEYVN